MSPARRPPSVTLRPRKNGTIRFSTFDKVESIIYDTAGQPHTKSFVEENGIPSNNPTNSKKVQKKSHYDDDAWIIRTAISQYENDDGVYSDIYEVVGNISEKMP